MTTAEKLVRIAENEPKVYEAGRKEGMSFVADNVGNALKGSASGETIVLKDVSPIEHNLGVRVESKNLLPYPFFDTTKTANGITFTDNGDGSITMNGVCSGGRAIFYLYCRNGKDSIFNLNQNLTLSGVPKNASDMGFFVEIACNNVNDGSTTWVGDNGTGWLLAPEWVLTDLYIVVKEGSVLDNVTFYPMLEKGITKTEYTSYLANLEAVKVIAQGKNFINSPDKTVSGTTAWYSEKLGSYTLPNGTYAISCDVKKSASAVPCIKLLRLKDGSGVKEHAVISNGKMTTTFTVDDSYGGGITIFLYSNLSGNAVETSCIYSNIQVELDTATEYEPYKEPIEYSQGEDIKSIYPSTTIMTDTKGALITVEYNRDINKAFAELQKAIAQLGG